MDKKLTDNEIVKALEEWIKDLKDDYKRLQLLDAPMDCFEESHANTITKLTNALDLINRLQAENERLNKANTSVVEHLKKARRQIKAAKAEAYKEFAGRLKTKASDFEFGKAVWVVYIDNLLKELVGENDAR